MILWVWAGEWFIRSLSAGLLSVRAIRGRIIVSRVLGTLQRAALQSAESAVPRAHLSTVLSRIVFMLSRPCKPHPTLGPWIVFGEFYPALTIRHDDWAGQESYNFSIKLQIRWWIPLAPWSQLTSDILIMTMTSLTWPGSWYVNTKYVKLILKSVSFFLLFLDL